MNKKNIILGLSLMLSSVATLNLASCSCFDDDDDDNHAPESLRVDPQAEQRKADSLRIEELKADSLAEAQRAEQFKAMDEPFQGSDSSTPTPFEGDLKDYVADMFRNQIKTLAVADGDKYIVISFNTAKSDAEAVSDKLNAATKVSGDLTTMIRKTYPNAKNYGSGNVPTGKKSFFLITYKK